MIPSIFNLQAMFTLDAPEANRQVAAPPFAIAKSARSLIELYGSGRRG